MTPTASGMFPGAVEITICDHKIHLTPAQAMALARSVAQEGTELVGALIQAAHDAESFTPSSMAFRVRAACKAGRGA